MQLLGDGTSNYTGHVNLTDSSYLPLKNILCDITKCALFIRQPKVVISLSENKTRFQDLLLDRGHKEWEKRRREGEVSRKEKNSRWRDQVALHVDGP